MQIRFTITNMQRRGSTPGQLWEYCQDAQNTQSRILSILSSYWTRRGYTPSIPEKFYCMGLMWIIWCPACLPWGHMGAQDIYRLAGAPTYSYFPKSSSPQRRGSGVTHWSFPRWLETLTMFTWYSQVIWSSWRWVQEEGVHEYVNHGCSTQARCYIITLASDCPTCPSHLHLMLIGPK